MNVIAVVGSPRKGEATDTLVEQAVIGVKSRYPDCHVKKIHLADQDIRYCRDCLACWKNESSEPYAPCVIRDDMDGISKDLVQADSLILGTPVHFAYASALMMTFLERICWTFAKPARNYVIVKGCPAPRVEKKRKAVIITVSGMIPPRYKKLCNAATPQIKGVIKDSLNAETIATLYAGDIWHKGVDAYLAKAFALGGRLG